MDDYKGFRRFAADWSKSASALFVKLWLFVGVFVIIFFVGLLSASDHRKLSNVGGLLVSSALVQVGKGDVEIHYYDDGGGRLSERSDRLGQVNAVKKSWSSVSFVALLSALVALIIAFIACVVFARFFRGYHQNKKQKKIHLRGAKYVDVDEFKKYIQEEGVGTDYPLGDVPWIKEKVRRHLSISGDTGVGKSQALMRILEVVREKGEKAFVLDKNGEMLSHFYNPETDIILSPFDDRSKNWTPFMEGGSEADLERMAKSFISTTNAKDDHWPEASVTVFSALLYQVTQKPDFNGSIDHILVKLLERTKMVEKNLLGKSKEVVKYGLMELLDGTLASLVIDPDAPEHAKSVIASIVPKIRSLRYLRGLEKNGDFSIREWVKKDSQSGWVFIRVNEDEMDAVSPLVSAWFDTFIKSVMSLPKSDDRIIWNVIDELQSLAKINTLQKALFEGRKHGLRNILGFTSVYELFNIYGERSARAMMSMCNAKMVFQTDEPGAAKWNSELLGMEEVVQENESHTFGDRDSQGVSDQRSERSIVMASEIQGLESMHAYLKFSGGFPVTKTKTEYKERPVVAKISVPRDMPAPLIVKQKVIRPEQEKEFERPPLDENHFRVDEPLI